MAPLSRSRLSAVLAIAGCCLVRSLLVFDQAVPSSNQDGGAPCTSGAECWWNGVCTNKSCACYDAWTGPECNLLAEGESVQLWPNPSLPLLPDAELTDSWGSTVQRDDATGDWWMYVCVACVFSNGTPQPFSMHNSGIVAARAPALEGPYEYAGPFTGIFSEGPHMTRGPGGDAAYLLITPGGGNSSTPVTCTGAPCASASLRGPARLGNVVAKNVWSAPSPAGPWTPNNFTLNETGDLAYFSNPVSQAGGGVLVWAPCTAQGASCVLMRPQYLYSRRASPLTTRLARGCWRGASTSFRRSARGRRWGLHAARASAGPTRRSPSRSCPALPRRLRGPLSVAPHRVNGACRQRQRRRLGEHSFHHRAHADGVGRSRRALCLCGRRPLVAPVACARLHPHRGHDGPGLERDDAADAGAGGRPACLHPRHCPSYLLLLCRRQCAVPAARAPGAPLQRCNGRADAPADGCDARGARAAEGLAAVLLHRDAARQVAAEALGAAAELESA